MGIIKHTSAILNDDYTQFVYDTYDIQNREESVYEIQYDISEHKKFDWNVGVILGGSGSGKTSILKQIGEIKKPDFDFDKPLISNFDWLDAKEVTMLLTSIGLSSVPTWLRPFKVLSNGEQYRATLAYLISSAKDGETIIVDEYTSVVDRDVAKAMSFALQKYIRREKKKIILASCHYDILEWLMPDWVCNIEKGGVLEKDDYLRQQKLQVELRVSRVEYEVWNIFKKHHYLTHNAPKSAKYFLFEWNNKPVAINCVISQPSGTIERAVRGSRTVVLPDFQGFGIGSRITNFMGGVYKDSGYRYFTKTINPALGEYRNKMDKIWKTSSKHGRVLNNLAGNNTKFKWDIRIRTSYCHEYIGDPIPGYEYLLLPVDTLREQTRGVLPL
jgi:ABC-type lipoprotein export system ATPase subunit/GNAT superfamily N-acetyltransferase